MKKENGLSIFHMIIILFLILFFLYGIQVYLYKEPFKLKVKPKKWFNKQKKSAKKRGKKNHDRNVFFIDVPKSLKNIDANLLALNEKLAPK